MLQTDCTHQISAVSMWPLYWDRMFVAGYYCRPVPVCQVNLASMVPSPCQCHRPGPGSWLMTSSGLILIHNTAHRPSYLIALCKHLKSGIFSKKWLNFTKFGAQIRVRRRRLTWTYEIWTYEPLYVHSEHELSFLNSVHVTSDRRSRS